MRQSRRWTSRLGPVALAFTVGLMALTLPTVAAGSFTATLEDKDGYINGAESVSGVPARWQTNDSTASAAVVRFEARLDRGPVVPVGCGPTSVATSGSTTFSRVCAANLPDGPVFMVVEWRDAIGRLVGKAEKQTIKDTQPPVAAAEIIDPNKNGLLELEEIRTGSVRAQWHTVDGDGVSSRVRFTDSKGVIPKGCGPFPGAADGVVPLNTECATNLPEGQFFFRAAITDVAGNASSSGQVAFVKDTGRSALGALTIKILDGDDLPNQAQEDITANIAETQAGTAFAVAFDLTKLVPPEVTRAKLFVTDKNGTQVVSERNTPIKRSDPEAKRTLTVNVTKLADGPIKTTAQVFDSVGNVSETKAESFLDLHAPTTKITEPAPDAGTPTLVISVAAITLVDVTIAGTTVDEPAATGIKVVHVHGTCDCGLIFTHEAHMDADPVQTVRDGTEVKWSMTYPLSTGTWTITAQGIDLAGNVEQLAKPNTTNMGMVLNIPFLT